MENNPQNEIATISNKYTSVHSAKPTQDLEVILNHLQKTEYVFANEKATYIFKQAVAILNHVARNGYDKSEYCIDAGYLYEKIDKINDELSRRGQ